MYLRQYLHLPSEIVPSTLKRTTRSDTARPRAATSRDAPKSGEDRQAYRRAPGTSSDKKADVGAGAGDIELVNTFLSISHCECKINLYKSFFFQRGGFGRGRAPQ